MPTTWLQIFCLVNCLTLTACDWITSGKGGDSPKPGDVLWSVDNSVSQINIVQPLIDEGNVYFYQDGRLKSYELKSAKFRWSRQVFDTPTGGHFRNKVSDAQNIYIYTGFYARSYKKQTGELNWHQDYTNDGSSISGLGGARFSQDNSYLYLPARSRVLMVRKSDGNIVREFPLNRLVPNGIDQGATDPIPSPYGDDLVYIPTAYWDTVNEPNLLKGNVFAFDKNTGEVVWEFQAPNKLKPTDEFATKDSLIVEASLDDMELTEQYVVVTANTNIILLDRFTGEKIWQRPLKSRMFDGIPGYENSLGSVWVGLEVDDTGIYLAMNDLTARKLSWQDGSELWRVNIRFSNTSIPTVIDGKLYFNNSGGGGIWVIDTMTGKVLYNKPPPGNSRDNGDVYLSSLGVGQGYMVNVGSKRVYALRSFE